jgi:hypothetical protein
VMGRVRGWLDGKAKAPAEPLDRTRQ